MTYDEFNKRWARLEPQALSLWKGIMQLNTDHDSVDTSSTDIPKKVLKLFALERRRSIFKASLDILISSAGIVNITLPTMDWDVVDDCYMLEYWRVAAMYSTLSARDLQVSAEWRGHNYVRVNAPRWYLDSGFLTWLNAPRTATWHVSGEAPDEMSDVFTTWDDGEGPDAPGDAGGIPTPIWLEMSHIIRDQHPGGVNDVAIHISNLAE